ncbi:MAG: SIR2 family protein [Bacteroidia bacterium]|jgi:hypothetical protein|nr:SIR2 family protein [Bacteroidia bacterium]
MSLNSNFFDPTVYLRGLQQILISDSKKIGFLFGAGTSCSVKKGSSNKSSILDINKMTKYITENLGLKSDKYQIALDKIHDELNNNNVGFTIENLLSNITQKHLIIGDEILCGLNKDEWFKLKNEIEEEITKLVSVHKNKEEFCDDFNQGDFAQWIKNSARKEAIEIFTTNYDYLLEIALEHNNVPYYDGFIGSYCPFFYSASIEDMQFMPTITKLWKLHGSLGWCYDMNSKKITQSLLDDNNIVIYPSYLKYSNTRKQPYTSFLDRLSRFIKRDDTILFICGYSFGDYHINEIINTALEQSDSSHVVVFFYDKYIDEGITLYQLNGECDIKQIALANNKLSVYGMNSAVIGGKYGIWKLNKSTIRDDGAEQMTLYFDDTINKEGSISKNVFTRLNPISLEKSIEIWESFKDNGIIDEEGTIHEEYSQKLGDYDFDDSLSGRRQEIVSLFDYFKNRNGEGELKLPDFSIFVYFLKNINADDYIKSLGNKDD